MKKPKVIKENEVKKEVGIPIVLSILISMVFFFLVWYELGTFRKSILDQNIENQTMWLDRLAEQGMLQAQWEELPIEEGLISAIKKNYPTSARNFCILSLEDEILFVRDDVMTSEVLDKSVKKVFSDLTFHKEAKIAYADGKLFTDEDFQVVSMDMSFGNKVLKLSVCTEEKFILSSCGFDTCNLLILVQSCLFAFAYIICMVYLYWKKLQKESDEEKRIRLMVEQRKTIEQLQERMESRLNGTSINGEGGLYSKEIVEKVLFEMTEEQKTKSRQLVVHVEEQNQDMFLEMGVLLDRLLTGMSVGCLWNRNTFLILLMDVDDAAAMNFARQIIVKYQNTYQKDVTATKISIDRL